MRVHWHGGCSCLTSKACICCCHVLPVQVCLLLPWLEPSWLDRAVAQGKLVLKHPEAGLKTPPWLQLSMAGSWTMLAVRSNVLSPRSEWSHYPFQVAMWQCQGLRSYLQLLGLRSTAGGLKPATFLQLCETTAVLACAVATRWAYWQQAGSSNAVVHAFLCLEF